jgi:cytochrome c oxidase assembly protein subunit 15
MAMMLLQLLLGIAAVIYLAPASLALLHQFGAVLLFTLILRARFLAQYPISQSVRGGA